MKSTIVLYNDLLPEYQQVLALVANELFDCNNIIDSALSDKVQQECVNQAVAGVALNNIAGEGQKIAQRIVVRHIEVEYSHIEVHELLASEGIPYVMLKGCVSASYYPEPVLRAMGDVDFLVHKTDFERTCELLRTHGLIDSEHIHACERAFDRDGITWEVHHEVNGLPDGQIGERLRSLLSDIIEMAHVVHTENGDYMSPSPFHHGLVMLVHVSHHMVTSGVGLRQICDWAVFANHFSSDEFRNLFEKKLKDVGLWEFAKVLTQFCTTYLGLPPKEWAGSDVDNDLLKALLEDIFSGGNFGQKEASRLDEAKFITNRKKGTIDNASPVCQLVQSLNDITRTHWPIAKRFPILLPFGDFYYGLRYFIRILLGKRRKINVFQTVKNANSRKAIYKKLKLYIKD